MKTLRLKRAGFFILFVAAGFIQSALAQNFTFTIEPDSLTLVPGQSASFVVSVTPFDGFTNQVSLSVSNMPSGVTASFSPQTLTPPGTSLLTLNATTNAMNGSFMLDLIAAGGGITNMATSSVSVSFGLLPICYGAFQGTVTDTNTGLPVPYATVVAGGYYSAIANASGQYLITNLPLSSSENLPLDYNITASQSNYLSSTVYAYAVCDATNTVNLQILLEQEGSISGTLISDAHMPLTNVAIEASYQYSYVADTDTNGLFEFKSLALGANNTPVNYEIDTAPLGYWYIDTNAIVQANSNSVLDLVAVPVCYQTVSGSVVYSNTGLPATNISVEITTLSTYDGYGTYIEGTTDTNGSYTFTNVTLGYDNTPREAYVEAYGTGYYGASTNVMLSECSQPGGPVISWGVLTLDPVPPPPPPPTNNYGALTGYVYDAGTGLPITNAEAYIPDVAYTDTDTNGAYLMTNIVVGSGTQTNATYSLYGAANNYFASYSNVTVDANQTNVQNLYLLRIGYGYIVGTVFNASTGLPVSGIYVSLAGGQTTGANGEFASGPLQLDTGNTPAYESFFAESSYESTPSYYMVYTNTTISNNFTNVVNIEMIQVCTGATIVGNVVNALTQAPITNAEISTSQGNYVMTDTNGDFILTNVTVGNNNSPIQTTLTATAPGFNPQTKTLTIFCDATISTEFGAPETAFGAIDGYVTNAVTGQPLTNVFIGSSFGEASMTDSNGYYLLTQAPLGANGSNRTWTVTAGPVTIGTVTYPAQNKSTVVSSNMTNLVDFGFGQALTELVISAIGTPEPVTVGSNLLYTVTLTNEAADASAVVLSDTLPPGVTFVDASITNNPDGEFVEPTLTNGMVTITATNFSSNSAVVLLISVTPTAPGILTNVATVTSETPDVNPTGTNHIAIVTNTAVAPPKTELVVAATGMPDPVTVGSNLLYTITLTNLMAGAADVVLADTLPPGVTFVDASITNNPGGQFGVPVLTDGVVTITAANFVSNSGVVLLISVTPTVAGTLTNVATVTSPTPDVDATDAKHTAMVLTTVVAPAAPLYADLDLTMTGAPNPVLVSNQLTYKLYVTNFGPANAPGVVLTDSLPANVTFSSASVSQGSYALIPNGVQWNIGVLDDNGSASATLVVLPLLTGEVTNTATVSITPSMPSVTDTNLANNTASVVNMVTALTLTNLADVYGPNIFNPQTGLFQQTNTVTNLSGVTAAAVRVAVLDLPSDVDLYNATGSTDGVPYVEYDQPVPSGSNVVFLLEYYESTRLPFLPTNFAVTIVAAVTVPPPVGTYLQLDRAPFVSEGQLTIEFASVPGHTYVVQYSSDMETWETATPPIDAKNTRTVWIDAGPPVTASPPGSPGQRFYRIVQTN